MTQGPDKSKQNVNELVTHYGPLGPRDLLAAALMMRHGQANGNLAKKAPLKVA